MNAIRRSGAGGRPRSAMLLIAAVLYSLTLRRVECLRVDSPGFVQFTLRYLGTTSACGPGLSLSEETRAQGGAARGRRPNGNEDWKPSSQTDASHRQWPRTTGSPQRASGP